MKIKTKESYMCRNCKKLKKGKHEMNFGVWEYKCIKYNIGRDMDSDSCEYFERL